MVSVAYGQRRIQGGRMRVMHTTPYYSIIEKPLFEIEFPLSLINVIKGSCKEWALGGLGFIFGMSCRVGYGYWARGSGPWTVRASKKSARAISTPDISGFERHFYDDHDSKGMV